MKDSAVLPDVLGEQFNLHFGFVLAVLATLIEDDAGDDQLPTAHVARKQIGDPARGGQRGQRIQGGPGHLHPPLG